MGLTKLQEITFESGATGWMGYYDNFIVPCYPGQTKEYVLERIEAYKRGEARYFKI